MACVLKKDFSSLEKQYDYIYTTFKDLIKDEDQWLPNAANAASLLYFLLEDLNWVGFYLLEKETLVLGPFCGKPAVTRIPVGQGVCGDAAKEGKIINVKDVHQYPGHIACDLYSNSEIVLPLFEGEKLIGVLDIDSPVLERFTKEEEGFLEKYADLLAKSINFPQKY